MLDFQPSLPCDAALNLESSVLPVDIWSCIAESRECRLFLLEHPQYYLPGCPLTTLAVAVVPNPNGASLVISDQVPLATSWVEQHRLSSDTLAEFAEVVQAPVISLNDALKLVPIHIAKPWGREIWYTGIEARGQSGVSDGLHSIPLPWLLAIGAEQLLQVGGGQPNLLKILDPLPEEVFGDLYFELHEEKREVYVVTGIDRSAWPDGHGAIRYGFDQKVRAGIGDDEVFRDRYLQAVKSYEIVRREIDTRLDNIRVEQGVELNAPVSAATLKAWQEQIPSDLLGLELKARAEMNRFTSLMPLQLGDVVKVSCLTPHALQHGVRTVEFQSPVYERKILNFAQKVLTQDHWDSDEAVAIMSLETPPADDLVIVGEGEGFTLEQVVSFDDFRAYRLTLLPGADYALDMGDSYKIVMIVDGQAWVGQQSLAPEEAALVPRTATDCRIANRGGGSLVCLISLPTLS